MELLCCHRVLNLPTLTRQMTNTWRGKLQTNASQSLAFSLTEEAMVQVIGLSTARNVWLVLEDTFSHRLKARELCLNNDLQLMKRGTKPVVEHSRAFKALCDQLHKIGCPVDDTDKVH